MLGRGHAFIPKDRERAKTEKEGLPSICKQEVEVFFHW